MGFMNLGKGLVKNNKVSDIKVLTERINKFRDERDWMQFHNHKDMAISLVLEASELLEHFQWKSPGEINKRGVSHKEEISEEIADIAIYLLELADNLKIDLNKAIENKLDKNSRKYPVEKARGSAKKYSEL